MRASVAGLDEGLEGCSYRAALEVGQRWYIGKAGQYSILQHGIGVSGTDVSIRSGRPLLTEEGSGWGLYKVCGCSIHRVVY